MSKPVFIKSGPLYLMKIDGAIHWSDRKEDAARFVSNQHLEGLGLDLCDVIADSIGADVVPCETEE